MTKDHPQACEVMTVQVMGTSLCNFFVISGLMMMMLIRQCRDSVLLPSGEGNKRKTLKP